jgi:hypothetical protein
MPANHSAPRRMIGAMLAKVSTLLMSVGQPHRPLSAGTAAGPRRAALALDGGHEGGFLAADVGPGADADVDREIERRLKDAAAEKAELLSPA